MKLHREPKPIDLAHAHFALWGFRRGDLSYEAMPAQRAYEEGLTPIATASMVRDWVTVARRA